MKFFLPATLAILLAACAFTPEDKEAAHQHQLEKEARENFYALKAQEHPNAPPAPAAAPTPAPHLLAFLQPQPPATHRAKAAPKAKTATVAKARAPQADDTLYYWQVQPHSSATNLRFQVAEARYARQLAKNPENLTPEERVWAHEHF